MQNGWREALSEEDNVEERGSANQICTMQDQTHEALLKRERKGDKWEELFSLMLLLKLRNPAYDSFSGPCSGIFTFFLLSLKGQCEDLVRVREKQTEKNIDRK